MTAKKLALYRKHWKLFFHLFFRTKHFGVNNSRWSNFPSLIFGWPWYKILWAIITIRPLIDNYRMIQFRAEIGFVNKETLKILGWNRH